MTKEDIKTLRMIASNCALEKVQRDMLTEITSKEEKYAWHDLKKNPKDVPMYKEYDEKYMYDDEGNEVKIYSLGQTTKQFLVKAVNGKYAYDVIQFWSDNSLCSFVLEEDIVAWREIDAFDGEVSE